MARAYSLTSKFRPFVNAEPFEEFALRALVVRLSLSVTCELLQNNLPSVKRLSAMTLARCFHRFISGTTPRGLIPRSISAVARQRPWIAR
jgi:hypothetical protein